VHGPEDETGGYTLWWRENRVSSVAYGLPPRADARVELEARLNVTHPPLLVVLSGPSGVGKDTVLRALKGRLPDIHYAVTATTRPPRPGETEGKSYFFLNQDTYDGMLDRGELLAPAEVHGHWYGAPLPPIRRAFAAGSDLLLKIDVQGALQVRRRFPGAVFIFLAPPSLECLLDRLAIRHTESPEELERRVRDAHFEMGQLPQYDYLVVNNDSSLDSTVGQVECIVTAERLRLHRQSIRLENH
jgi:guanylate kinase